MAMSNIKSTINTVYLLFNFSHISDYHYFEYNQPKLTGCIFLFDEESNLRTFLGHLYSFERAYIDQRRY